MRQRSLLASARWVLASGALVFAEAASAQGSTPFPEPEDPDLQSGWKIWLGTCRACHANLLSDAPQVRSPRAWSPRLEKSLTTLYSHALEGFTGPSGTEMPARGGNRNLTDDEVKAAVDYMISLVKP